MEREQGEVAEPNCLIDRNVVRTWTEENFSSILQCRRQRRVNSTPLRGPRDDDNVGVLPLFDRSLRPETPCTFSVRVSSVCLTGKYGYNLNSAGYRPRARQARIKFPDRSTSFSFFLPPSSLSFSILSLLPFSRLFRSHRESTTSSPDDLTSGYLAVAQFQREEGRVWWSAGRLKECKNRYERLKKKKKKKKKEIKRRLGSPVFFADVPPRRKAEDGRDFNYERVISRLGGEGGKVFPLKGARDDRNGLHEHYRGISRLILCSTGEWKVPARRATAIDFVPRFRCARFDNLADRDSRYFHPYPRS